MRRLSSNVQEYSLAEIYVPRHDKPINHYVLYGMAYIVSRPACTNSSDTELFI